MLKQEKILWFQKSRMAWLMNGDRNTKYFHSRVKARRKTNRIESLLMGDEGWCYEDDKLKQHAVEFFQALYTIA